MDLHDPGITAKDVAEAHQEDLKIQEVYNCRALTYGFDEERQTVFCLMEAPDNGSVKEMHDHVYNLFPPQLKISLFATRVNGIKAFIVAAIFVRFT